jgi:SAM-dependent methyltransferase
MASIDENRAYWAAYDWPEGGHEWSRRWGGSATVWHGVLMPRIHRWLPTGTILEIGAGFGRWTEFLKNLGNRIVAVDLVEKCITQCRQRFQEAGHATFYVTDGRSLPIVPTRSVDFVFSFDSLVHADELAIEAYLRECARVLTPNGIAFIHHSNLGAYSAAVRRGRALPPRLNRWLAWLGITAINGSWRDEHMTAERFAALATAGGLQCITQEIVPWTPAPFILRDCLSTLTPATSIWARPTRAWVNRDFLSEQRYLARRATLYSDA